MGKKPFCPRFRPQHFSNLLPPQAPGRKVPWASDVAALVRGDKSVCTNRKLEWRPYPGACVSEPCQGRKVGIDDPPGSQHPLTSPLDMCHCWPERSHVGAAPQWPSCETARHHPLLPPPPWLFARFSVDTGLSPGLQVCSDCCGALILVFQNREYPTTQKPGWQEQGECKRQAE